MFKRVLVPLDTSPFAEAALPPAIAIARDFGAELEMILVHEFPMVALEGADVVEQSQRTEEAAYVEGVIQPLVADLQQRGMRAEMVRRQGRASETIVAHARPRQIDLVVIASHGRTGFRRALLGSVADRVMHEVSCPVLMVRPGEAWGGPPSAARTMVFRRIVVPLDGSASAEAVLGHAEALARKGAGALVLVRIVAPVPAVGSEFSLPELMLPSPPDEAATAAVVRDAEEYLARVARDLERRGPLAVETHVHLEAHVGPVLAGLVRSHGADLVAMTTHGRGSSRYLIGSVADAVLRGTDGAVLMHRQPG